MFSEVSEECVKQAIHAETEDAVVKWGKTYSSLHEGYAVLKEEVEEAGEEFDKIANQLEGIWLYIREPKMFPGNDINNIIEELKDIAENLALETIQIAAVANKLKNMIE